MENYTNDPLDEYYTGKDDRNPDPVGLVALFCLVLIVSAVVYLLISI